MDYVELFKRAFQISAKYRALWIFGFTLALCGGGGSSGGGNFTPPTDTTGSGDFPFDVPNTPMPEAELVIAVLVAVIFLVICLSLLGLVIVQVSRTALIGMVNRIEENGTTSLREGWSLGWSYRAVSLFLVSLTIAIPIFLLMMVLFLCAISPFLLILTDSDPLMVLGGISGAGLVIGFIFFSLAVGVVAGPFYEIAWRYTVLKNLGPINSVTAAYHLIRQNLKEVIITVLLFVVIAVFWAFVSLMLGLLVVIVGGVLGVGPAYLAYLATESIGIAVAVAVPILLITVVLPLTFVQGLYLVFQSTLWTLIFRQLITPPAPKPAPTPPAPVADSVDAPDTVDTVDTVDSPEPEASTPAEPTPTQADSPPPASPEPTETLSGDIVSGSPADDDSAEPKNPPSTPPTG